MVAGSKRTKWVGRVPEEALVDFEEVIKAVREVAERKGNELTCHEARHLAEELDVEYSVVGRACNKLGVRMRHCQWAPWCVCEPNLDRRRKKDSAEPGSDKEP